MPVTLAANGGGDDLDRGESPGVAPRARVALARSLPPELRCQDRLVEKVGATARVYQTLKPPVPSGTGRPVLEGPAHCAGDLTTSLLSL